MLWYHRYPMEDYNFWANVCASSCLSVLPHNSLTYSLKWNSLVSTLFFFVSTTHYCTSLLQCIQNDTKLNVLESVQFVPCQNNMTKSIFIQLRHEARSEGETINCLRKSYRVVSSFYPKTEDLMWKIKVCTNKSELWHRLFMWAFRLQMLMSI